MKIIVGMCLLVLIGCGTTAVTKITVRERVDTLFIKGDTIRIIDAQSDTLTVERVDTLFRAVRASIDTTVQGVRIDARYRYPPDRWDIGVMERDTVHHYAVRDSIVERPYAVEKVPFWVYLAMGGMIVALLAAIFKR
jgi:hypothetical protein